MANPFFIVAYFVLKKSPFASFLMSIVAIYFCVSFLSGGKVMMNEAGHTGYITKIQIGYWFWFSSIIIVFTLSLVKLIFDITIKGKSIND